ncbi:MAG: hypothetical protein KDC53_09900 [Saprospiraceae bacterium]|nr:hypothetical protein [Saprospiraceae bacterium]
MSKFAEEKLNNPSWKEAKINQALGIYILLFGIIIMVAHLYCNTFLEKVTDLVAGLILVLIGGGMTLFSQRRIRKLNL